MYNFVLILHAIFSLTLVGIILIQKSKGGGLAANMGGIGDSVLGPGAGSAIRRLTTTIAILFMITSTTLAYMSVKRSKSVVSGKTSTSPELTEEQRKQLAETFKQLAKQKKEKAAAEEQTVDVDTDQAAVPAVTDETAGSAETTMPVSADQAQKEATTTADQVKTEAAKTAEKTMDSVADRKADVEKTINDALSKAQKDSAKESAKEPLELTVEQLPKQDK